MVKLWYFLMSFGLSHIGKKIKGKVVYKEILLLFELDPKGYPSFLRRGVMVGLGPRLWTGLKNSHARPPPGSGCGSNYYILFIENLFI